MPRSRCGLTLPFLSIALALLASPLAARAELSPFIGGKLEPRGPEVQPLADDPFGEPSTVFTLRTLAQVRYGGTLAEGATPDERATARAGDGWQLGRMFLRATAAPTSAVSVHLMLDLAQLLSSGNLSVVSLAYGDLRPTSWLGFTAGVFKRRFSLLELFPISEFELTSQGPTDAFLKDLGFAGTDVGGMIRLGPGLERGPLELSLGAFSGAPLNLYTASVARLLTGRLEARPFPSLRVGADLAWRTRPTIDHIKYPSYDLAQTVIDQGEAASADVTVARSGFELRIEGILGTRTDARWRQNARDFYAVWALGSGRFAVGKLLLRPAVRVEWLDADSGNPGGGRADFTAGLNIDFNVHLRLSFDVSRYLVQPGSLALSPRPWPNKAMGTPAVEIRVPDVDSWAVAGQLQVRL